jgi:3-hydroxyisobutyrate dehydrogenase-like beta-hydroxyacid dehydrogenase
MRIGLLHPGAMGAAVGACFTACGHTVSWVNQGRSPLSQERAARAGLLACADLEQLTQGADLIISLCPPHAATTVASAVALTGYAGKYLEANAIAPSKLAAIDALLSEHPIHLIDGCIIGGPVWPDERPASSTTLHLSGSGSGAIAALLAGSPLHANHLSDQPGEASALKMVFAAFSKGSAALTAEILNVAEQYGVREALSTQLGQQTTAQWQHSLASTASKAWRFKGEMQEISETFDAVGAEPGFHQAAAAVYQKLSDYKDWETKPDLSSLLASLANGNAQKPT